MLYKNLDEKRMFFALSHSRRADRDTHLFKITYIFVVNQLHIFAKTIQCRIAKMGGSTGDYEGLH